VTTNEAAFRRGLTRRVEQPRAEIARLDSVAALDERIVALRERVDAEARSKLREGVITAADFVDRNTELVTARLDRARHRVELAQAQAALLNILGLELP